MIIELGDFIAFMGLAFAAGLLIGAVVQAWTDMNHTDKKEK